MSAKKREGKKRKSPCTPLREKGKAKETKTKTGIHEYSPRPRARTYACTQEEAKSAAGEALKHFGSAADAKLWMWYCRRIGLNRFLDILDWTIADWGQHEIKRPVQAFQKRLCEAFPKGAGL